MHLFFLLQELKFQLNKWNSAAIAWQPQESREYVRAAAPVCFSKRASAAELCHTALVLDIVAATRTRAALQLRQSLHGLAQAQQRARARSKAQQHAATRNSGQRRAAARSSSAATCSNASAIEQ